VTDPLSRLQAALAGRYAIERELGRGGVHLRALREMGKPVPAPISTTEYVEV
jgi:hypothetical protein